MNSKYVVPNQRGNATWIVVGIIALIALGIAWWAFNRTGTNLSDEVGDRAQNFGEEVQDSANDAADNMQNGFNKVADNAELAAARVNARTELIALQTKLEADQDYEAAAERANEIEANLQAAYSNASAGAQDNWVEVKAGFDQFEEQLRAGTADALDSLGNLIDSLKVDVRSDTETNVNY